MKLRYSAVVAAAAFLCSASAVFAAVPNVTGLSDDFTPHRSKTWTWSADQPGSTFRYHIDKDPDGSVGDRDFRDVTHATQHSGNGVYYIHVQAHNDDGDGPVRTVQALIDTKKPKIADHADINVDPTGDVTTVIYDKPTATDNIDPVVAVTCTPESGTGFTVGRHEVVCTATDTAGNKAKRHFKIKVKNVDHPTINIKFDTPVDIVTDDLVIAAAGPGGTAVTYHVTSVDDPKKIYTPEMVTCKPASGSTFPIDVTPIICSITVSHKKIVEETPATVTVEETTAPLITLHGDSVTDVCFRRPYIEPGVLVTDDVDGNVDTTVDVDGPLKVQITSDVNVLVEGTYHVTYEASDSSSNEATPVVRAVRVWLQACTGGTNSGNSGGGGGGGGSSGSSLQPFTSSPEQPSTAPTGGKKPESKKQCVAPKPYVFTRTLSLGSVNEEVRRLQQFLNKHGFPVTTSGPGSSGKEITRYNAATKAAVLKYQNANKEILKELRLTVGTGIFAAVTRKHVNGVLAAEAAAVCPPAPPAAPAPSGAPTAPSTTTNVVLFTRYLRIGSVGEDVRRLQRFLNTHGFPVATSGPDSSGNETTRFDAATRNALIKFQEAHAAEILAPLHLTSGTGYFGPSTLNFVNGLLKAGQ